MSILSHGSSRVLFRRRLCRYFYLFCQSIRGCVALVVHASSWRQSSRYPSPGWLVTVDFPDHNEVRLNFVRARRSFYLNNL